MCNLKNLFTIIGLIRYSAYADYHCGTRTVDYKQLISFGEDTLPGDWPWHAAIFYTSGFSERYICGGSVITNQYILTAAHCLEYVAKPYLYTINLGKNHLFKNGDRVQEYEASSFKIHENYDENTLENDIALIRLSTNIEHTDFVGVICPPLTINRGPIGGVVVGWGKTEKGKTTKLLQKVNVEVIPRAQCLYGKPEYFKASYTEGKFCAGKREQTTSVCEGDSGGGYVVKDEHDVWHLMGLVSSASRQTDVNGNNLIGCDVSNFVLYTNVTYYWDWVVRSVE